MRNFKVLSEEPGNLHLEIKHTKLASLLFRLFIGLLLFYFVGYMAANNADNTSITIIFSVLALLAPFILFFALSEIEYKREIVFTDSLIKVKTFSVIRAKGGKEKKYAKHKVTLEQHTHSIVLLQKKKKDVLIEDFTPESLNKIVDILARNGITIPMSPRIAKATNLKDTTQEKAIKLTSKTSLLLAIISYSLVLFLYSYPGCLEDITEQEARTASTKVSTSFREGFGENQYLLHFTSENGQIVEELKHVTNLREYNKKYKEVTVYYEPSSPGNYEVISSLGEMRRSKMDIVYFWFFIHHFAFLLLFNILFQLAKQVLVRR